MKILLDSHNFYNNKTGLFRYWKNLSQGLKKYKNIEIIDYDEKINNGLYRVLFGFNQAIKKYQPDLIHVQNFTPIKKTLPIVNTVHDLCFKNNPFWFSFKSNLAFKLFFKRSLKISDQIIAVSQFTKNQLIRYYSFCENKIDVVYEAADPIFKEIKNKNLIKEKLERHFQIKNPYFLVVGDIIKRKRVLEIVEVFRKIKSKIKNIELILVGPNKLHLKEESRIKILNFVDDQKLNYLYNGALALINFSACEGFGLPLVEAMPTKTPIICSSISVFREIANNSALLVDNKKDLYQAMLKIYQDKKLWKKYSLLSYQRSKFFSWEKTIYKTLKVYKKALLRSLKNKEEINKKRKLDE